MSVFPKVPENKMLVSVITKLSDSGNISNTSEAYASGPRKEIESVLPLSAKHTTRDKSVNPK